MVIALALISNPKILLLDEATSAMDKKLERKLLIKLLFEDDSFVENIIYVTHDPNLLSFSDLEINVSFVNNKQALKFK